MGPIETALVNLQIEKLESDFKWDREFKRRLTFYGSIKSELKKVENRNSIKIDCHKLKINQKTLLRNIAYDLSKCKALDDAAVTVPGIFDTLYIVQTFYQNKPDDVDKDAHKKFLVCLSKNMTTDSSFLEQSFYVLHDAPLDILHHALLEKQGYYFITLFDTYANSDDTIVCYELISLYCKLLDTQDESLSPLLKNIALNTMHSVCAYTLPLSLAPERDSDRLRNKCVELLNLWVKLMLDQRFVTNSKWPKVCKLLTDLCPRIKSLVYAGGMTWITASSVIIRLSVSDLGRSNKQTNLNTIMDAIFVPAFASPDIDIKISAFTIWKEFLSRYIEVHGLKNVQFLKLFPQPLTVTNTSNSMALLKLKLEIWSIYYNNAELPDENHLWPRGESLPLKFCTSFLNLLLGPFEVSPSVSQGRINHIISCKYYNELKSAGVCIFMDMLGHSCPDNSCNSDENLSDKFMITYTIPSYIFANNYRTVVNCVVQSVYIIVESNNVNNVKKQLLCLWESLLRNIAKLSRENQQNVISYVMEAVQNIAKFAEVSKNSNLANYCVFPIINAIVSSSVLAVTQTTAAIELTDCLFRRLFKVLVECSAQTESLLIALVSLGMKTPVPFLTAAITALPDNVEHLEEEALDVLCKFWHALAEDSALYVNMGTVSNDDHNILKKTMEDMLTWPLVHNEIKWSKQQSYTWLALYSAFVHISDGVEAATVMALKLLDLNESVNPNILVWLIPGLLEGLHVDKLENDIKVVLHVIELIQKTNKRLGHLKCINSSNKDNILALMNSLSNFIERLPVNAFISLVGEISGVFCQVLHFNPAADTKDQYFEEISNIIVQICKYVTKLEHFEQFTTHRAKIKKLVELLACNNYGYVKDLNIKNKLVILLGEEIQSQNIIEESEPTTPKTPMSTNKTETPKSKRKLENRYCGTPVSSKNKSDDDFVVIPQTWSFEPAKLTEHQREKMKERRTDIPALYCDLSQTNSQDSQIKPWTPLGIVATTEEITGNSNSNTKLATPIMNKPATPKVKRKSPATSKKNFDDECAMIKRNDLGAIGLEDTADSNTCNGIGAESRDPNIVSAKNHDIQTENSTNDDSLPLNGHAYEKSPISKVPPTKSPIVATFPEVTEDCKKTATTCDTTDKTVISNDVDSEIIDSSEPLDKKSFCKRKQNNILRENKTVTENDAMISNVQNKDDESSVEPGSQDSSSIITKQKIQEVNTDIVKDCTESNGLAVNENVIAIILNPCDSLVSNENTRRVSKLVEKQKSLKKTPKAISELAKISIDTVEGKLLKDSNVMNNLGRGKRRSRHEMEVTPKKNKLDVHTYNTRSWPLETAKDKSLKEQETKDKSKTKTNMRKERKANKKTAAEDDKMEVDNTPVKATGASHAAQTTITEWLRSPKLSTLTGPGCANISDGQMSVLTRSPVELIESVPSPEAPHVELPEESAEPKIESPDCNIHLHISDLNCSIVSSPENAETHNRNSELLNSTTDISPIKLPLSDIDVLCNDVSPDVLKISSVMSVNSPSCELRLSKPKLIGGRTAAMMKMVTSKTVDYSTRPKEVLLPPAASSPLQQRHRGMLMLNAVGDQPRTPVPSPEKIQMLHISKDYHYSPAASPSASILKKRKSNALINDIVDEDVDESPIVHTAKRPKLVSFHDPPVSSTKHFEIQESEASTGSPKCTAIFRARQRKSETRRRLILPSLSDLTVAKAALPVSPGPSSSTSEGADTTASRAGNHKTNEIKEISVDIDDLESAPVDSDNLDADTLPYNGESLEYASVDNPVPATNREDTLTMNVEDIDTDNEDFRPLSPDYPDLADSLHSKTVISNGKDARSNSPSSSEEDANDVSFSSLNITYKEGKAHLSGSVNMSNQSEAVQMTQDTEIYGNDNANDNNGLAKSYVNVENMNMQEYANGDDRMLDEVLKRVFKQDPGRVDHVPDGFARRLAEWLSPVGVLSLNLQISRYVLDRNQSS